MAKGVLFFFLFAGTTFTVFAQFKKKETEEEGRYREAVTFFKQEKYQEAFNRFSVLLRDNSSPERNAYAHYFYAAAAGKLNKPKEGWQVLQQLLNRYPGWAQKDEAYYLAGDLHFRQKSYARALEYLQRITTSALQKDVEGLKLHYLGQLTGQTATLRALQKQFPTDRVVASCFVQALQKEPASKGNSEMIAHLVSRYDLAESAKNQKKEGETGRKEKPGRSEKSEAPVKSKTFFEVAVLLPFRIDEFEGAQRSRSNQFVYDYYQGMLLAQNRLKAENIELRLYSYDVGNNDAAMKSLTRNKDFAASDLLIGPLYAGASAVAADFANDRDIVVVNPLSTDSRLLTNQYPNFYLTHPSLELQVKQVRQVAEGLGGKPAAVIYYGETAKDSTMAAMYAKEIQAVKGVVLGKIRIGIKEEEIAARVLRPEAVKPTHTVLFSTDARTGPALLNVLRDPKDRVPFIATAVSFDFENTRFGNYQRDIYLLDTDYADKNKVQVRDFQKNYYDLTNTLPSVYSYQGYDHLLFFGRMLAKYGKKIKDGIQLRKYGDESGGYLLNGFDYGDGRENTVFSVRKYLNGEWKSAE